MSRYKIAESFPQTRQGVYVQAASYQLAVHSMLHEWLLGGRMPFVSTSLQLPTKMKARQVASDGFHLPSWPARRRWFPAVVKALTVLALFLYFADGHGFDVGGFHTGMSIDEAKENLKPGMRLTPAGVVDEVYIVVTPSGKAPKGHMELLLFCHGSLVTYRRIFLSEVEYITALERHIQHLGEPKVSVVDGTLENWKAIKFVWESSDDRTTLAWSAVISTKPVKPRRSPYAEIAYRSKNSCANPGEDMYIPPIRPSDYWLPLS